MWMQRFCADFAGNVEIKGALRQQVTEELAGLAVRTPSLVPRNESKAFPGGSQNRFSQGPRVSPQT